MTVNDRQLPAKPSSQPHTLEVDRLIGTAATTESRPIWTDKDDEELRELMRE